MISFYKKMFFDLGKSMHIILAVLIFTSLLLSAVRLKGKMNPHNKPCCLKGYICQTAMKNIGR